MRRAAARADRRRASGASAASRTPRTATSSTSSRPCRTASTGLTSCSTARTARPPASRPRSFHLAGAEVIRDRQRPRRHEHQRRRGLDPPRAARRRGAASTAPTSASPTTATPTAASRWTRTGNVVDGDQIMAILAMAMHERGALREDTLVATVMSNLGLHRAMRDAGIAVLRDAGRRPLRARGARRARPVPRRRAVGPRDHGRPRDDRRRHADRPAPARRGGPHGPSAGRAGRRVMTVYPQVLVNVRGVDRHALHRPGACSPRSRRRRRELGDTGRVLLRPSGTEPRGARDGRGGGSGGPRRRSPRASPRSCASASPSHARHEPRRAAAGPRRRAAARPERRCCIGCRAPPAAGRAGLARAADRYDLPADRASTLLFVGGLLAIAIAVLPSPRAADRRGCCRSPWSAPSPCSSPGSCVEAFPAQASAACSSPAA